ncbi:hypothetical protein HYV82_04070 [Candidatus Woesearchaeota archaeon]|nr:hypothetical protein [Candidatus Woesearchaeota archaeon]
MKRKRTVVHGLSKELAEIMFWVSLLALIIANLLVTIVIVPLVLAASALTALIVAFLGLFAGKLFAMLIANIGNIETKHHIIAATLVPGLAVMNLFILIAGVNRLAPAFGLAQSQDPLLISIVYVASFLTPYLWANVINRKN